MPVTDDEIDRKILTSFESVLDDEGVTFEFLAKKRKRELDAKKTDTFLHQQSGEIKTIQVPDWPTRQRAGKDLLAYRRVVAPEKISMEHSGSVNYSNMTDEELDAKIKEGFNAVYGPKP